MINKQHLFCILICGIITSPLAAQDTKEDNIYFEDYNPESTLVVPEHPIKRAKYPFIDVHNHQWGGASQNLKKLQSEMDSLNMGVMINLSGRGFDRAAGDVGSQQYLNDYIASVKKEMPGRMMFFTNVSFKGIGEKGWEAKALRQLEEDVKAGACGLKIYKSLGFGLNDHQGNRVTINDPRLDPIWAKCGQLGIPVLIHAADPKPFWFAQDRLNERWLELKLNPGRKRSDTDPAPWEQIIAEQHDIFRKHPKTKFINAHFGWYANDLGKLSELLDTFPNMSIEFGAVIAELGRQPQHARAFFIKYQDRILFGKDAYHPHEYHTYFRVLESNDEYFPYYKKYHAFWAMYGLNLPDDVLRKVYYKNALKLIPGIDASLFPE